MEGVVQCSANYTPLSPISFLERAAIVYGDKVSMVYGTEKTSWKETHQRCIKLASSLVQYFGISRGDTVAAIAPNVPALYELHFGVPMAGAVLSALNTKLDATMLALLLEQLEAKIIFIYYEFVEVVFDALNILSDREGKPPVQVLVLIAESDQITAPSILTKETPAGCSLEYYNALLARGRADFEIVPLKNECDPISVNYTSGSTGIPKGAIYSHRAAYLNSLAAVFRSDMRQMPVFLWTVDMFRCNGWCFTWAMAALGGTNIFLRTELSSKFIFDAIYIHKVTHLCGAPTILNIIADAPATDHQSPLPSRVNITVAGALPPPQILMKVTELGFNISHGYGMTEALGPAAILGPWESRLENSSKFIMDEQTERIKGREGLHNLIMDGVDVKDPKTMKSTPCDGKTIGEVMLKGNALMLGYIKNPKVAQEAFRGGWYHSGDLAIRHPDGFVQIKDRAKDIIISSEGEAISTLEVEAVLLSHPKVLNAAVVGRACDGHPLGDQAPYAFVKLKKECDVCTAEEIIKFCGDRLPKYMAPHGVVFGDLPVNSTGKIQKFVLREKVNIAAGLALQNGLQ
ncbi:probable acyl-activating enzyme 1, peroxisomal [Juglans microcarpa x Juglans regia]|uniref:probable acyl-activating enzyme 1, peroxisomal n=1 Tax=Juglans microcarpa x Juglans regia TaxID=2249226 RepID=UPI001B7F37B3|nr:probable acyl-activating enzyme 1, peroxisomal [Juglans microcarpa x Juglans regia]